MKTLEFQSLLSCKAYGREFEFESNIVTVELAERNIINQKSLPITSDCLDEFLQPQHFKGSLYFLIIFLLCR